VREGDEIGENRGDEGGGRKAKVGGVGGGRGGCGCMRGIRVGRWGKKGRMGIGDSCDGGGDGKRGGEMER